MVESNKKLKELKMSANEEKLLKIKKVREYVDFSPSKIYALLAKNEFPKPHKIGGSSVWKLSDIQNYIAKVVQSENN
jgi:prophage regulatory protein